jgi:hypothetical protein
MIAVSINERMLLPISSGGYVTYSVSLYVVETLEVVAKRWLYLQVFQRDKVSLENDLRPSFFNAKL